jgi:hypothetical protein
MLDKSIVYYTGNGDYPKLEEAVRDTITRHSDGMPIVSVSHQPLDFGTNICVGPLQQSPEHVFMQLRLGAQAATSKYVCVCEADTLYPEQFFRFDPPRSDTYYYPKDGYITWTGRGFYWEKRLRELTGIVAREHLLRVLGVMQEKWFGTQKSVESGYDSVLRIDKVIKKAGKVEHVDLGDVVTLKTDRGMHMSSPHSRNNKRRSLQEWGSVRDMWKKYQWE